jgi:hypothetical protein
MGSWEPNALVIDTLTVDKTFAGDKMLNPLYS